MTEEPVRIRLFHWRSMRIIRSRDNQIYKLCNKLLSKKYRDSLGQYLIEGEKLYRDALAEDQKIKTLILAESYGKADDFLPSQAVMMDGQLFQKIAQTETSQGLIAIAEKPDMSPECFQDRIKMKGGNVAVLDRLQDPGNIGTIIRTADAAGYCGIITLSGTVDPFSPKIVRAAAGSLFRIPILTAQPTSQVAEMLHSADKKIVSTCFDTDTYYYDVPLTENVALVIGNEGNGISEELLQLSDLKIKIPMEGNIDSLNASVAAGILMYESVRK